MSEKEIMDEVRKTMRLLSRFPDAEYEMFFNAVESCSKQKVLQEE